MRVRQIAAALHAADVRAFRRIARMHNPALDSTMPILTRTADHSVLWLTVAALLIGTGDRRLALAGRRGVASIAVSSFVANLVLKRSLPRDRPVILPVPLSRQAFRIPTSSSFPSGHSASAAAFAYAVGREVPELAAPVGLLAGTVAFSRIYTGVHYPGDVLAGVALGAGVAAGLHRVFRAEETPRPSGTPEAQPPRPDGAGVVAVINPRSGSGRGAHLIGLVRDELPAAEIVEAQEGDDISALIRDAAARAEVLAIGGGDGTVACAAGLAVDHGVPLLVLSGGTFNHFATDLGVVDPKVAVELLREGSAARIDLTRVDGRTVVNTASVGAYPAFVAEREKYEDRFGKPLAAAYALLRVLRTTEPVELRLDGAPHRTSLFFLGSGRYEPRGFAPNKRTRLDDGLLDVRLLEADGVVGTARLLAAVLVGRLRSSPLYREISRPSVVIERNEPGPYAHDGEVEDGPATLAFRKEPRALVVFAPQGSERA